MATPTAAIHATAPAATTRFIPGRVMHNVQMFRTTVFLLAFLAPAAAFAQSNPPPSVVLPTVIVTAQKEASDVKEVPASVTAVTAETIADSGIRNITEAAIFAPNTVFTEFTARKVSNA